MSNENHIMIRDVRVSFPDLFKKAVINGEVGKYGAILLLDPKAHAEEIKRIEDMIAELCKFKFKGRRLPSDKLCLRDGDDTDRDEYAGYKVLSARNPDRPVVIAADGRTRVLDPEANPIYSGCHTNAKIALWAQDNTYGKRVNATLIAIQFAKDGEPLSSAYVSEENALEGFSEIMSDDDFLAA